MDKMTIPPVICLMGPTASGKTELACRIAQRFSCEIISVDSAMIYRHMNVGTAKPNVSILTKIPHHLIDILNPDETYSVAQFCNDAQRLCKEIQARGKIPLFVGGTMMYFRALQQGLAQLPEADSELREELIQQAQEYGWAHLHQRLQAVDPSSAARIHPHDTQRIQRALEVYLLTGQSLSAKLAHGHQQSSCNYVNLLLVPEARAWLHERIALRFKLMLQQGLIEEVEDLISQWSLTPSHPSIRSVGYRQVYEYLQRGFDQETLCNQAIVATRQLAKRQLTWLRHWPYGHIFLPEKVDSENEIMEKTKEILDN